jgi:hypothetical protein
VSSSTRVAAELGITLLGDPTKAKDKLGWTPGNHVQEMCAEMVAEDLKVAQRHAFLKAHGHYVPVATEKLTQPVGAGLPANTYDSNAAFARKPAHTEPAAP